MPEHKESVIHLEDQGTVRISEDVVATIASMAASEVDGVSLMVASGASVSDLIGKKQLARGVKITQNENRVSIDLNILVSYGKTIPSVAQKVQERVISSLSSMTGLTIGDINIRVGGIVFEKEPKRANPSSHGSKD